jgi:hypothetical protein
MRVLRKVSLLSSAGMWSGEGDGARVPFSSIHVEAFLMPVSPLMYVQMLQATSAAKSRSKARWVCTETIREGLSTETVKPRRADCTARESVWQSRSLPAQTKAAALEVIVAAVKRFTYLGQLLQISRHCVFDEIVGGHGQSWRPALEAGIRFLAGNLLSHGYSRETFCLSCVKANPRDGAGGPSLKSSQP